MLAAAGIEFDGAFDDDVQEVGRIALTDQGDAGGEELQIAGGDEVGEGGFGDSVEQAQAAKRGDLVGANEASPFDLPRIAGRLTNVKSTIDL